MPSEQKGAYGGHLAPYVRIPWSAWRHRRHVRDVCCCRVRARTSRRGKAPPWNEEGIASRSWRESPTGPLDFSDSSGFRSRTSQRWCEGPSGIGPAGLDVGLLRAFPNSGPGRLGTSRHESAYPAHAPGYVRRNPVTARLEALAGGELIDNHLPENGRRPSPGHGVARDFNVLDSMFIYDRGNPRIVGT